MRLDVFMSTARRAWAELCSEGVSESTAQYFDLQQIEALGHVRDLEQALEQVRELERQRAELWREAAHDLRGNLGVVANATAGLSLQGVPDPLRDNFLRMLKKNVSSLHTLLDDVMNLARLQAGHERRVVRPFDAGVLLAAPAPLADGRAVHQAPGEGIGRSIVERLCELLDAAVEMESDPGKGTTLRIVFPRRYDRVEHKQ